MDKKLQRHNEWVARFNAAARRQSRGAPPLNTDKPSLPKLGLHSTEEFFEESEELFERAKARVWLRELDRLSDLGLWFEELARRCYDSEIDAAVDLLRCHNNPFGPSVGHSHGNPLA